MTESFVSNANQLDANVIAQLVVGLLNEASKRAATTSTVVQGSAVVKEPTVSALVAPPQAAVEPPPVHVAAPVSRKRSRFLDDWECPVCSESLTDGAVPAVLNGCLQIAHVICMTCANRLLRTSESAGAHAHAQCPECRAPFVSARPLAAFVDSNDARVAETLAKKTRSEPTLEERVAALNIANERVRQRVLHMAKRIEDETNKIPFTIFTPGERHLYWFRSVAAFDDGDFAMTVKAMKHKSQRRYVHRLSDLQYLMHTLSLEALPYLQTLFAGRPFTVDAAENLNLRSHACYLGFGLTKKAN